MLVQTSIFFFSFFFREIAFRKFLHHLFSLIRYSISKYVYLRCKLFLHLSYVIMCRSVDFVKVTYYDEFAASRVNEIMERAKSRGAPTAFSAVAIAFPCRVGTRALRHYIVSKREPAARVLGHFNEVVRAPRQRATVTRVTLVAALYSNSIRTLWAAAIAVYGRAQRVRRSLLCIGAYIDAAVLRTREDVHTRPTTYGTMPVTYSRTSVFRTRFTESIRMPERNTRLPRAYYPDLVSHIQLDLQLNY